MLASQEDSDDAQIKLLSHIYWTTIILFWSGLPFCLSHGILAGHVLPALGLVPLCSSMVSSIYRLIKLHGKKNQGYQIILNDERSTRDDKDHYCWFLGLVDLCIVVFHILVLSLTCASTYASGYSRHQALAAYATVFMFVDTAIHVYLFYNYLYSRQWRFMMKRHDCARSCPNCRAARETVGDSGNRYRDLPEVATSPEIVDHPTRSTTGV